MYYFLLKIFAISIKLFKEHIHKIATIQNIRKSFHENFEWSVSFQKYKVDMHDVETIRNRVSAFSWVHLIYFNQ